jgi:tripartite-type tricarboxylate transporter receptor subunit TctC
MSSPAQFAGLVLVLVLLGELDARAQVYPSKPVRLVVAVGAGGADDFQARILATKLSELLGQPFIVENRPGAGGRIGERSVVSAMPDGYTLLMGGGSMTGARYTVANLGYDVLRDFSPVALVSTSPAKSSTR